MLLVQRANKAAAGLRGFKVRDSSKSHLCPSAAFQKSFRTRRVPYIENLVILQSLWIFKQADEHAILFGCKPASFQVFYLVVADHPSRLSRRHTSCPSTNLKRHQGFPNHLCNAPPPSSPGNIFDQKGRYFLRRSLKHRTR